MAGTLHLIPTFLDPEGDADVLAALTPELINKLDGFVVEREKTARQFLKRMGLEKPLREVPLYPIDAQTTAGELDSYIKRLKAGENLGLMSEAGSPGVADPGAALVSKAHQQRIAVRPVPGPSSILLALMASGLNGQSFTFHGYLPREQQQRSKQIRELEKIARSSGYSQLFMETPYRNDKMVDDLLQHLRSDTTLCLAVGLTEPKEMVRTLAVSEWRKQKPKLHKRPAIFIIGQPVTTGR